MDKLETQCKDCVYAFAFREVTEEGEPLFNTIHCVYPEPSIIILNIIRDCSQYIKKVDNDS